MSRPEPIIEYARKIGKNTAEFTVKDLAAYMKWWFKQPPREDLIKVTPEQRKVYQEDVKKVQQYLKEKKMGKSSQYNNAMRSRMTNEQLEGEVVSMNAVEVDAVEVPAQEIVVEMGLTRTDIDALLFCIERTFEDYEMAGHEFEKPLSDLHEGLQGVE